MKRMKMCDSMIAMYIRTHVRRERTFSPKAVVSVQFYRVRSSPSRVKFLWTLNNNYKLTFVVLVNRQNRTCMYVCIEVALRGDAHGIGRYNWAKGRDPSGL